MSARPCLTFQTNELVSLEDIVISSELRERRLRRTTLGSEFAAMHALAKVVPQGKAIVLKRLATLLIELCGAGSAGVSIVETDENGGQNFRWQALAGELKQHEGSKTPRDWSPCGECLRTGEVMLYSYPARYFTYFQKFDIPIVEGLVVPMCTDDSAVGTVWVVSHDEQIQFDAEDARMMTSLGSFAVGALPLASSDGRSGKDGESSNHEFNALRHNNLHTEQIHLERAIVWKEYVRRIAHEDHLALAALLNESSPLVFATALRVLSFRADAEEVTADVFAHIWRKPESYDAGRGTVEAWLVSIARSRAIDRLRSRTIRNRFEAAVSVARPSGIDPESRASASQTRTHLLRALHSLPHKQRRAIELAYFSELTMTEISEQLGHPIGSVKTRIRMGLIELRRLLAADVAS